jgi:hypothetical protein
MICENCQQHEATYHLTTIEGDAMEVAHLCLKCYEADSPEAKAAIAARDAHCEYCGGQPCVGGTDLHAALTGLRRLKLMCLPCSLEHLRYSQMQLPQLQRALGLAQPAKMALLGKLDKQADKHMEQWLAKRRSR